MSSVTTLYGMSRKKRERLIDPAIGLAVKAQRVRKGLSQEQVSELTDNLLYPRLQSEVENGKRDIRDLSFEQVAAMVDVLEYTPTEFSRDLKAEYPVRALPSATDYRPTIEVPMFGDVAAGVTQSDEDRGPPGLLDPNLPWLRGRDPNRLAMLRVNGDSMVSPEAEESIPHGAIIVVEWGAMPQLRDFVVAWIHDLSVSVLKRYDEDEDVVLSSLNHRGPVFRASEYEIDLRGVVRIIMRAP